MRLIEGHFYTREQIHDLLGGGVQDYLPHKNGRVVCGCFKKDTNPDAPNVVLPGDGPKIQKWAKVFREQNYPVPIFIKKDINKWEYVGDYQVKGWTDKSSDIFHYAKTSGRNDVTSVLFLERR
jgi:hypothetical protein